MAFWACTEWVLVKAQGKRIEGVETMTWDGGERKTVEKSFERSRLPRFVLLKDLVPNIESSKCLSSRRMTRE